jgi:hypothetical protein
MLFPNYQGRVEEAVRRLRDNDAGLKELEGLKGEFWPGISDPWAGELAEALAVNTILTRLSFGANALSDVGGRAIGKALAVNTTLTQLGLALNSIGLAVELEEEAPVLLIGQALAVNTTLKRLDLEYNNLGAAGGRAIGEALALNTTLTQLNLRGNWLGGNGGGRAIGQALAVNRALTNLDLRGNNIGIKGARKIGQALQVNRALTTLRLNNCPDALAMALRVSHLGHFIPRLHFSDIARDQGFLTEIDRLLVVNRALDSKLLAVMMSVHARLGARSGLRVLDNSLVTMICDMFCRESKASSLLDEGDAEEEGKSDSGHSAESNGEGGCSLG